MSEGYTNRASTRPHDAPTAFSKTLRGRCLRCNGDGYLDGAPCETCAPFHVSGYMPDLSRYSTEDRARRIVEQRGGQEHSADAWTLAALSRIQGRDGFGGR